MTSVDSRSRADLEIENALLRHALHADGALLQFVRRIGLTLFRASGVDAARRLSDLVIASDAARDALRARGICTNG